MKRFSPLFPLLVLLLMFAVYYFTATYSPKGERQPKIVEEIK